MGITDMFRSKKTTCRAFGEMLGKYIVGEAQVAAAATMKLPTMFQVDIERVYGMYLALGEFSVDTIINDSGLPIEYVLPMHSRHEFIYPPLAKIFRIPEKDVTNTLIVEALYNKIPDELKQQMILDKLGTRTESNERIIAKHVMALVFEDQIYNQELESYIMVYYYNICADIDKILKQARFYDPGPLLTQPFYRDGEWHNE